MTSYIKPIAIKLQILTERGFLYNSPGRDVGAKQGIMLDTSAWDDTEEETEDVLPKQKSLWDDDM